MSRDVHPVRLAAERIVGLGFLLVIAESATTPQILAQPIPTSVEAGGVPISSFDQDTCRKCAACHRDGNTGFPPDDRIIDMYEWNKIRTDEHSQAPAVLTGPRAARIQKTLQKMPGSDDVSRDRRCTSCHDVGLIATGLLADTGEPERLSNCELCHGPSKKWYDDHSTPSVWRIKSPEEKQQEFGMYNVRDSVKRAELCLSCHLGNSSLDRVVTHEMYAAGHPPLPSFEIETFAKALPTHWHYEGNAKKQLLKQFHYDPETHYRTTLSLVASAVALREAAALLRDLTAPANGAQKTATPWPEFAAFDCYACHHELLASGRRADSTRTNWRRDPEYIMRPPGMPRLPLWPTALAEVASSGWDGRDALNRSMATLRKNVSTRAFGRADEIHQAARQAHDEAEKLVESLAGGKVDAQAAKKLLQRLCEHATIEVCDVDTARQIKWALATIYDELAAMVPSVRDAEIRQALSNLDQYLGSTLSSSEPEFDILKARMTKAANYNYAEFQRQIRELKEHLSR